MAIYGEKRSKRKAAPVKAQDSNPAHSADTQESWELDHDLNAMARAHAIKQNPALFKKVQAHAKSKLKKHMQDRDEASHKVEMGTEKDFPQAVQ